MLVKSVEASFKSSVHPGITCAMVMMWILDAEGALPCFGIPYFKALVALAPTRHNCPAVWRECATPHWAPVPSQHLHSDASVRLIDSLLDGLGKVACPHTGTDQLVEDRSFSTCARRIEYEHQSHPLSRIHETQ